MVEGTRLEVVCARGGTEGSNPSLSVPGAMQNKPFEPRQVWKEAAVDWFCLCRSFPGFLFTLPYSNASLTGYNWS